MSVRAKFFVHSTTSFANDNGMVTLSPVCRGEDNKEWSKWTPAGKIEMTINNPAALEQFVPGEEFYVDFTPAPKGQEG